MLVMKRSSNIRAMQRKVSKLDFYEQNGIVQLIRNTGKRRLFSLFIYFFFFCAYSTLKINNKKKIKITIKKYSHRLS
jgi:hypothetical protein